MYGMKQKDEDIWFDNFFILDRAGGEAEGEGWGGGPQDGRAQGQGQEGARGLVSNNIFENQLFASSVVDPHPDSSYHPDADLTFHLDVDPDSDPSFQKKSQTL